MKQNFVALDELARLLDRLGRAVAVVIADEVDLAAVDAAGVVDHLEIGGLGLADHAVSGSGTAIGHDVADLDFGIGRAGIIFLLRERAAARCRQASECGNGCDRNSACENSHDVLPLVQCLMAVWPAFLNESSLNVPCVSSYQVAHKKKPSAQGAEGCFFSRRYERPATVRISQRGMRQLLSSLLMMSPNSSHFSPLNRIHLQLLDRSEIGRARC